MSINVVGIPTSFPVFVNQVAAPTLSFASPTHTVTAVDFGDIAVQQTAPPVLGFAGTLTSINLATNVQQVAAQTLALVTATATVDGTVAQSDTDVTVSTPLLLFSPNNANASTGDIADWFGRSTGQDVLRAINFNTAIEIDDPAYGEIHDTDARAANHTWIPAGTHRIKPVSGGGHYRQTIPATGGTAFGATANWRMGLADTAYSNITTGSIHVQFRILWEGPMIFQPHGTSAQTAWGPSGGNIICSNNGTAYVCVRSHTSSAATEPGVGDLWTEVWVAAGGAASYTAWATATAYAIMFDNGSKISILSRADPSGSVGSNQNMEVVLTNNNSQGFISGYLENPPQTTLWRDFDNLGDLDGGYAPDTRLQPEIDRGVQTGTVSPLYNETRSQANLDNIARYGALLSSRNAHGLVHRPDPVASQYGMPFKADTWTTIDQVIDLGPYNSGTDTYDNTRVRTWAAYLFDTSRTLLFDQSINMPADGDVGYSGLWMLCQMTDRVPGDDVNRPQPHRDTTYLHIDEMLVSSSDIAFPADPRPSWVTDIPADTWSHQNTSVWNDVDPDPGRVADYTGNEGFDGIFDDWTGAAYASNIGNYGGLICFGGGHNAYHGNGVYYFDLDDRTVKALSLPATGANFGNPNVSTGLFPNNTPSPSHTYDGMEYSPEIQAFIQCPTGDNSDQTITGFNSRYFHRFTINDVNSNTANIWSISSQQRDGGGQASTSARDPSTGLIWTMHSPTGSNTFTGLASYDPVTDTVTDYANSLDPGVDAVSAIKPRWQEPYPYVSLMVTLDARNDRGVLVRDVTNDPDAIAVNVTTTGTPNLITAEQGRAAGFVWCPPLGAFVAYTHNYDRQDLITLTPPPFNWRNGTWTWGTIDGSGGATPNPVLGVNRHYSKFQWADTIQCFILATNAEDGLWVFRPSL